MNQWQVTEFPLNNNNRLTQVTQMSKWVTVQRFTFLNVKDLTRCQAVVTEYPVLAHFRLQPKPEKVVSVGF